MWEAAVKIELMLGYAALAPRLPFSQWEATIRSSGSCSAVRCLLPSTSGSRQFRGLPQLVSGCGKPFRYCSAVQFVFQIAGEFAALCFAHQILSCRNLQVLKFLCHFSQVFVKIPEHNLGQLLCKEKVVSIQHRRGSVCGSGYIRPGYSRKEC